MEANDIQKRISENIGELKDRIDKAAERSGRGSSDVLLLGASKNRNPEEIQGAVLGGLEVLGENRVQEFLEKKDRVSGNIRWHFIGHLQRNKAKDIVGLVELIHSVDSLKLGVEINRRAKIRGIVQPILIQVNQGGEESKFGIETEEICYVLSELAKCENVAVKGFSTIAPYTERPEEIRWVFREMKRNMDIASCEVGGVELTELSMGMTNDYEVAVEEGATIVRIGTGIFGSLLK